MTSMTQLVVGLLLFAIGLRLSAFFSGSETAFYRVSFVRVTIDANAGDRLARRILWFARHPSYFVATALVGNNVANYVTTLAIGLAAVALVRTEAEWLEIAAAMLLSPVVFIFGELLPKNLAYRAPLYHLRIGARLFTAFYWAFLVVSFPLIWISRALERLAGDSNRPLEVVLGRRRLVQVLSEGRREGILTELQSRLVHGLLHTAAQPVAAAMTPADRVLGILDTLSREECLDHARRYGLSSITVRSAEAEDAWYGYVRVVDLVVTQREPADLVHAMPQIDAGASKLEALITLQTTGAEQGLVMRGATIAGTVSAHGLVEQLFRSPQAVGARPPIPT